MSKGVRRTSVLFSVIALLFVALVPQAGAEQPPRPFKGFVTGEVTYPFDDGCPLYPGTPPEANIRVSTHGVWSGTASHMGRVKVITHHCAPFPWDAPVTGKATIFAANGDQLVLQYYGYATPDFVSKSVAGDYAVSYISGTGRFIDADVSDLTLSVFLTFETPDDPVWYGNLSLVGDIDY